MNQTLRSFAAGAAGALLVAAVVAAQPAVADQLDKTAAKNSVNSKSIKDGSIKTKDLNAEVSGPLAKANTALQSVPDNSVTTPKLADNAVTNPKIADNAVGSAEVATNSLAATDLAANSVGASEVEDGDLTASDVSIANGVATQDFPNIPANTCSTLNIATGDTLAGDILLASPGFGWPSGLDVTPKPAAAITTNMAVTACNTTGVALDAPAVDMSWTVIENN
jgi:hypothetical protein